MATLIVGPFYLSIRLAQDVAIVGLIMAAGPVVVALTGVPAGRLADRIGARPVALAGLWLMLAGCGALSLLPASTGVPGYLLAVCTITGGYSLFQTGNNSSVLARAQGGRRGLVSGLLTLSRNIGLIAGASLMAGIFAAALGGASPAQAGPALVAAGLRATFAAGAVPILIALAMTWRSGRRM
jgi:MFS family permease